MIISFDIGVKHFAYCYLNDNILNFDIFSIEAKRPIDRIKNLFKQLEQLPKPETVIVEQQVVKNVVAMSLQNALIMYYLTKNVNVMLYNPKDKFKYENLKNFKNKEHKKISIQYAKNILKNMNDLTNLNKLSQFEKQDDVSDAICMTVFTHLNNDIEKIKNLIS